MKSNKSYQMSYDKIVVALDARLGYDFRLSASIISHWAVA